MKYTLTILACFVLLLAACKKEKKNHTPPQPTLPPYTEVGARTYGCMINGKLFLPKSNINLVSPYTIDYQGVGGGVFKLLIAVRNTETNQYIYISGSFSHAKPLEEKTYQLGYYNGSYNEHAFEQQDSDSLLVRYSDEFSMGLRAKDYVCKPPNFRGELTIKKLDFDNQIMAGTFWFDAVDTFGNTVEVRDGRFDLLFYR